MAKTLLRAGVGYKEFELLAKRAFIDVAAAEFGVRGRETNTSRIAVMTGLTRKEVAKLRNTSVRNGEAEFFQANVLHRWYTDPQFLGEDKQPLPLLMSGADPSFTSLVRLATSDLPAGAVRAELERIGALRQTRKGELVPCAREYKPIGEDALTLGFEASLSFLMSSIEHNLAPDRVGPLRPERVVISGPIPLARLEGIRSELADRISAFTEDMDDWFAAEECSDRAGSQLPSVGLGVYYFEEPSRSSRK